MEKLLSLRKSIGLGNLWPLLLAFGFVLLGGGALAQLTGSISTQVQNSFLNIVCPIANILTGPVARFVSLALIVGAVIYYMSNDSRTAKGLTVAAIVGIILANTFPTWQEVITGVDYNECRKR